MEFKKQNRGTYGKGRKKKEGNKPQDPLNDREQRVDAGRKMGDGLNKWVMGIKEGTCDELDVVCK